MAPRNKGGRKYGSAADRAKKSASQAGPSGGGGTMFKNIPSGTEFYNPEEGKATLRFLPYIVTDPKHPDGEMAPVDDIWYKRPFKRFRSIGADKKPYISPKSIGKPCPISEYHAAAKADPSISDKEANKSKAQDCVMYNVQVVDRKGNVSEPMFWWFSYACFEKQLKKELMDPDNEEFLAFMDLEGGFDVRVRWEKESFAGNDYLAAGNISFIERDDIDEDILDKVVNLDDVLVIKSYQELNNIFLELDVDDEEDDEEEEKPSRRRKKADPPEGEEEEEEEKPTRRRKKADPPEEKEEEEEKPTRRRKKAEPEPEPEPEPEKPTRRGRTKKEEPKNDCPCGYVFGDDFDTKNDCDKCKKFDECGDKFDSDSPLDDSKPSGKKKAAAKNDDDDDDDDDVPKSKAKGKEKAKANGDCPKGFNFGTDCDTQDECNDCSKWDECMDEQERLENE